MKTTYQKINRSNYSLGDLARIVQSCSRNSKEATAVLADLLASGRVVLQGRRGPKRVVVAS